MTPKRFTIRNRLQSFRYAFRGLIYSIRTQYNIWIHAFAGMAVIVAGCWYNITRIEWLFVIGAIGFVWVAELLNTAIEYLVDYISPAFDKKAGLIKDIAAGAVLMAALTAAAIGLVIFLPRIF